MARSSLPSVCLVGAGAMARALAPVVAREGAGPVLWSRRPRRAAALAGELARSFPGSARRPRAEPELAAALRGAGLVLLCVSDRAVAPVAREIAAAWPGGRGRPVAAHASGFLRASALRPLERRGFATGSLHPLVALPPRGRERPGGGSPLAGAWFRIEGDPRARAVLRRLVRAVEGRELSPRDALDPVRYHAAAALVAGGTVALFDAALELLEGAGAPRRDARRALAGLLSGVAANLEHRDPAAALTGPAARGDADVVAGHLRALRRAGPGLPEIYRELTRRMLALASARGSLDPEDRARLERLLDEAPASSG